MTDTHYCPPYMRSDDPEVLASIEKRNAARDQWETEVKAYLQKWTPSGKFAASVGRGYLRFAGLAEKPETGRWARGGGSTWRPYKNDANYAEFEALNRDDLPVLGMPSMMLLDVDDRPFFVAPFVFVHDGVTWAKASSGTAKHPKDVPDPSLWAEVKASEWHAAREAWNDAGVSV